MDECPKCRYAVTFKDDLHIVVLFNAGVPDTLKSLQFNVEGLVKLFIYDNNVVEVAFKLSIFSLL